MTAPGKLFILCSIVICLSCRAGDKPDETVPREYLGFAEVNAFRGVIDDPDGYVNLRKEKGTDAPVIAKVKAGEPFSFERKGDDQWCKVKLSSGKTGWMHASRIRLFFTKEDLPGKPEKGDEIDEQARKQSINYYEVTQAAARGDQKALKTFFSVSADGAGAEEHLGLTSVVIHLIGDDGTLGVFAEPTAQLPVRSEKRARRQRNLSISKPGVSPTPLSENIQTIFPARD